MSTSNEKQGIESILIDNHNEIKQLKKSVRYYKKLYLETKAEYEDFKAVSINNKQNAHVEEYESWSSTISDQNSENESKEKPKDRIITEEQIIEYQRIKKQANGKRFNYLDMDIEEILADRTRTQPL